MWALAGLSFEQGLNVIALNDGDHPLYPLFHSRRRPRPRKHTFSEIADVIESWFSESNEGVGGFASRTTKRQTA
jgi:hypothetical protein